jgi:ankyrin repeat protein
MQAFEQAVDAVVAGDVDMLTRLLRAKPELAKARSARPHRCTLLLYVGANGVEHERQKTPPNVLDVAKILLDAGSEVDAEADLYGGGATTLGLAATSIHPMRAGVQNELLQLLIEHGADINHPQGGGNGHGIVIGCLENGRGNSAEFLAGAGAKMDLEGAAGVGRLALVRGYFDEGGRLRDVEDGRQLQRGFLWACEYGRNDVVEFLLDRGADLNEMVDTSETGLHWSVIGGQVSTIELLLRRGADLERLNGYRGTALGQALWCLVHDPDTDFVPVVEFLLKAGSKVESGSAEWLEEQPTVSLKVNQRVAALLRAHEAK